MNYFDFRRALISPTGKTSTVVIEDSDKKKYDLYSEKGKLGNWQKEFINFPDKLHMVPDLHEYSLEEFLFQDILSWWGSKGTTLLVSKRLKALLEKFIMLPHRFYEVEVMANGRVEEYYILHMLRIYDYLNYEKSVFAYNTGNNILEYKNGEVTDKKEYIKLKRQLVQDFPESKNVLKVSHAFLNSYYDTFSGDFPYKFVITERVKEAMEATGITGARYEEVKKYIIEMPIMP